LQEPPESGLIGFPVQSVDDDTQTDKDQDDQDGKILTEFYKVGFAVLGCSNHLVDKAAFKGLTVRPLLIHLQVLR
jgi:hypothetical protein